MNNYLHLEVRRLEAEITDLDTRLAGSKCGPGLRTRSVHTFLSALRRHKREMLKDLDHRIRQQGAPMH